MCFTTVAWKAWKLIAHVILFCNIFRNLSAVNKKRIIMRLFGFGYMEFKTNESGVAINFSTLDNSLNVKLKILLLEWM